MLCIKLIMKILNPKIKPIIYNFERSFNYSTLHKSLDILALDILDIR